MKRLLLLMAILVISPGGADAQCLAARSGSPYDFSAAANTLFQTDFGGDAVGEFPKELEFKTGSMEVAEWQGKRALKASAPSALAIPLTGPLPESFSVEVSVVNRNTKQVGAYTVKIYGGRTFQSDFATAATRANYGTLGWEVSGGGATGEGALSSDDADACMGQEQTIRLQVDGSRLKLYADQRRLASVPNASFLRGRGIVIALEGRDDADNAVYLTGIRVAGGNQTVAQGSAAASTSTAPTSPPTTTSTATTTSLATAPTGVTATSPTGTSTNTATTGVAPTTADGISKASATGATPMTAPANFGGAAIGGGKVQLVWNSVPGAVSYQVWYTTPTYSTPVSVNLQPVTDTTLTTRQLNEGSVTLTVVANFGASPQDNGPWGPKSTPVTVTIPRYVGKYRVSILGFKVNNETFDNPVEVDGKRDEVYVAADAQEFDSLDAPVGNAKSVRTFTYGDVNSPAWQNSQNEFYRIKAGTASSLGGLKTGDGYPSGVDPWRRTTPNDYEKQLPLLVWEGQLIEDVTSVAIAPTIMESDDTPGTPLLGQFVTSFGRGIAPRIPVRAQIRVGTELLQYDVSKRSGIVISAKAGLYVGRILTLSKNIAVGVPVPPALVTALAAMQAAQTAYTPLFQTTIASALIASNTKDRPVGTEITSSGTTYFDPMLISLTYRMAEEAIAGRGDNVQQPGIIALNYKDNFPGGIGNYTLYVEVKRVP